MRYSEEESSSIIDDSSSSEDEDSEEDDAPPAQGVRVVRAGCYLEVRNKRIASK